MIITTCWIGSDVVRRCASRDVEPTNAEPPALPLHPDATRRVGVQRQRGRLGISRFYVAGRAPPDDVRPNPARRDYHAREPQLRQLFLSISGRQLRYAGLRAQ